MELGKQIKQSASPVSVAESKYSLPYDVAQTLKQRLVTSIF